MIDLILVLTLTLLLGAGNSVYHAERLRYGKTLIKKSDFDFYETVDDLHKITNPLKFVLFPLIIIFSYWLIKQNFWLFIISVAINMAPLNTLTVLLANIFIIPLAIIIAKIRRVKFKNEN